MQKFDYLTNKHQVQTLKRLFIPLGLFALAGLYLAWLFTQFELRYIVNLIQNSMLILVPLALLTGGAVSLQFWLKSLKQTRFPSLKIGQQYIALIDGAIEERVHFTDMHSIRLRKPGTKRESIQIVLNSGQSINISHYFPIESIKQHLNNTLDCKL